ncbi:hypothetical protein EYC84_003133 [Monilinia fructicola]|uniref:SKP1 component dimerisation domain-containing protein n=1 Tax=Monilinia fructicola TaxID=38448 RepID=A0A5M9JXT7_MONFR|nr:hypothetical protein EYC84_003133 [Monilinia fructicola]
MINKETLHLKVLVTSSSHLQTQNQQQTLQTTSPKQPYQNTTTFKLTLISRSLSSFKMSEGSTTTIVLVSNDNASITVDRAVAERSMLIKNMLEDLGDGVLSTPVPIPNVSSHICHHSSDLTCTNLIILSLYRLMRLSSAKLLNGLSTTSTTQSQLPMMTPDSRKKTTDIEEWDQKFMQVDQEMLFEIILAANYLDIKALLDVGCKTVANMIKGKSPEEIRKTFNITNDFTPEEEEQIRRENEWAEDRHTLPRRGGLRVGSKHILFFLLQGLQCAHRGVMEGTSSSLTCTLSVKDNYIATL